MAYISVKSKTSDSVSLCLLSLDTDWTSGTRTVAWYLGFPNSSIPTETSFYKFAPGDDIADKASSGGDVEFGDLEPNTRYYVYCQVYHGSSMLADFEGVFRTDSAPVTQQWAIYPGDRTIEVGDWGESETTVLYDYTIRRHAVVFRYSGYTEIWSSGSLNTIGYLSTNPNIDTDTGEPLSIIEKDDNSGDGTNFHIKCYVTADVRYYIFVRSYTGTEVGDVLLNIATPLDFATINKWDWFDSNGSASADITTASYYALSKGTPTTNFSHLVWEDMVDKVWEIIKAKTNWWDENYASLSDTKYLPQNSDGKYELTAVAFNSLRNNIELIGNRDDVLGRKTGIGVVYANDTDFPVRAVHFTILTSYINDCIDNL